MLALIQALANRVGANSCLLCGMRQVSEYGLCGDCEGILPRWYPRCLRHLASPTTTDQVTADYWFAALRWEPVTQRLISRYKTANQQYLSKSMSLWLAAHLQYCYCNEKLEWPDVVVAMPATQKSWRQRGFHHTGLLTQEVSRHLQLAYHPGLLRIIRAVAKQKQLNRASRWQQSQSSQFCTMDVTGKTIAVIDDLITSGATLAAAAHALKKRGASQVHGWALIYNAGD